MNTDNRIHPASSALPFVLAGFLTSFLSATLRRAVLLAGAAALAVGVAGCGGGGGGGISEPPPIAAPKLQIRSGLDGAASGPFQVEFTFDGDVAGFSQNSFTLSGLATVAAGSFKQVNSRLFTATINPRENSTGVVTVRVGGGAYTALGGQLTNTATYEYSKAYDTIKPPTEPSAAFSHVWQGTAGASPAVVTMTFDIDVQPFGAEVVTVSSGTLSGFTRKSARVYELVLTPAQLIFGLMIVSIPEGAVTGAVTGGVANTRPYTYGMFIGTPN